MKRSILFLAGLVLAIAAVAPAQADVRVKDLGRFLGWRDTALVGYGVVTGLTGSGDSPRSAVTRQALTNVLGRMGANVTPEQVQSRNVAIVMVTSTLPPSANLGDRIDINVTSMGDARSLAGGTLLMTPLMGPDQRSYALAQGPISVGGYRFNSNENVEQKNYPTAGAITGGATVETSVEADIFQGDGLTFLLREADFTTAERIADAINRETGAGIARVSGADEVVINLSGARDIYRLIARIENVMVEPDHLARVVVNERSGTVVAGGGVRISSVVISQGDIRVSVSVQNEASQPTVLGGFADEVRSLVVTNTTMTVEEPQDAVISFPNTTVADLIEGLTRAHVDTRGKIAVLQAMKTAGALHAEIIVQ